MAESFADQLARVPLLAGLDPGDLTEPAGMLRELSFEAGSALTREGERGARVLAFFVIVEGSARVEVGGERVRTLGSGDHFGEIALLRDSARTATVIAESGLRCLGLSAWDFRSLVEARPAVSLRLLEAASARLEALEPPGT